MMFSGDTELGFPITVIVDSSKESGTVGMGMSTALVC